MPITHFLERNAKNKPNEVALIEINPAALPVKTTWIESQLVESAPSVSYRKQITWREFDDIANQVARCLMNSGIKRGDKVAILLMNCLEWLPIYFGVLKTGAIAVPMNFRYTADEIDYCLRLSDSKALIFGAEFVERLISIQEKLKGVTLWGVNAGFDSSLDLLQHAVKLDTAAIDVPLHDDDDAAIYFSSGTTGFPKAILHSHAALVFSCEVEQAHHGQKEGDVFLCIPPLYHTGAKMHWFGSLISCGKGVLLRGTKPEHILDTASREGATIVWLLVPWAQDILDSIESGAVNLADYDLSRWRLMHIGAQPVPPSLIKRWMKVFPNHQYDTNYGLSESIGPGAVHLGVENMHKVGAIGIAGHKWQTRVVNEAGDDVPRGEVGELILKGTGNMRCYYNDDKATAAALRDGWLYTGDMAREDDDGFIFLVDRKKDVIITGGENLYPVQIEDFLRTIAEVKDVAVIGLPDKRLGEIAAAIIEVKEGCKLSEDDVAKFCEKLPRYKRPRRIIFDNVPRNPTGKIEKPKLRERYRAVRLVEAETTT